MPSLNGVRLISALEVSASVCLTLLLHGSNVKCDAFLQLALSAELILFAVTLEEFDALTAHLGWLCEVPTDALDMKFATMGLARGLKVRCQRMESAYAAAIWTRDAKAMPKLACRVLCLAS